MEPVWRCDTKMAVWRVLWRVLWQRSGEWRATMVPPWRGSAQSVIFWDAMERAGSGVESTPGRVRQVRPRGGEKLCKLDKLNGHWRGRCQA